MQAFPYMYKKSCSMKVSEIPVMLQDFYVFTVCSLSIKRSQTYAFFLETEVLIR